MRMMRIAVVTAGLMVAGGVFGTVAGLLVLLAWGLAGGDAILGMHDLSVMLQVAVVFGGGLGAVMGPVSAWVLMRRVPLWLAVGGTTLGTLASGGIGLLATADPVSAMYWGMAGFGITALGLNLRERRARRLTAG